MRLAWRLLALLAGILSASPLGADTGTAERVARVRAHLVELANLGPRPSGSPANTAAAEYIRHALASAGCEVRVEEAWGMSGRTGASGWARNVVGTLPAKGGAPSGGRDAILLCAHYDSVVEGPGATDNAASVAALLVALEDAARARRRERSIVALFSDAEERHLLGADAFARGDPLAGRIAAVVNFDHAGRAGSLIHFESAGAADALHGVLWSLPRFPGAPRSYSFARDIYRVLPFDTDFTALARLGAPGVNLGLVGNGYAYHTGLDIADGVPDASLRALLETTSGLIEALAVRGVSLEAGRPHVVFFPIGPFPVRLDRATLMGVALLGVVAAALAIGIAARRNVRGLLRSLAVLLLAVPLAFGLLLLAVTALRAMKGVDQVAYATPAPFFLLCATLAVLAAFLADMLLRNGPASIGTRLAAMLVPWTALGAASAAWLPSSSGFFVLPLPALALAALVAGPGKRRVGIAAATVALVLLAVWGEPLALVLPFLVTALPKGNPEPLPWWPAVFAVLGLVLGSALWAFLPAGASARKLWLTGAAALAAACAVWVVSRPAYDAEHPLRVLDYHVTTPERSFRVRAATDRLPGATIGSRSDPDDLFWLSRAWPRTIEPSRTTTPLPRVEVRPHGERMILEVTPPPGADMVTLVSNGPEPTHAPAALRLPSGVRLVRQIVAGGRRARFEVPREMPDPAWLRIMTSGPGLPGAEPPPPSRASWAYSTRTLALVDVPLHDFTHRTEGSR